MSYLILAAVLAAAPADTSALPPRTLHEISTDLQAFMKREALAETPEERAAAINDMSDLYLEMMHDPRVATIPLLKGYKSRLWSRLTRVKKDLQKQVAREAKAAAGEARDQQLVAQAQNSVSQDLAAQMALTSYSLGGPATLISESNRAFGGAAADDGEALIDLIERTIKPDFWDTTGGPGSIAYYQSLHALVISATTEVHEKIGGTLGALRRAGM